MVAVDSKNTYGDHKPVPIAALRTSVLPTVRAAERAACSPWPWGDSLTPGWAWGALSSYSLQISLKGLELVPPVTFVLKCGAGPVYLSGQHITRECPAAGPGRACGLGAVLGVLCGSHGGFSGSWCPQQGCSAPGMEGFAGLGGELVLVCVHGLGTVVRAGASLCLCCHRVGSLAVCAAGGVSPPLGGSGPPPPTAAMHLFSPVEDDAKSESHEDELSEEDNEDADGAS